MTKETSIDNRIKDALSAAEVFFNQGTPRVYVAQRAHRLGVSSGEWEAADGSEIKQVSATNLVDLETALRTMLG